MLKYRGGGGVNSSNSSGGNYLDSQIKSITGIDLNNTTAFIDKAQQELTGTLIFKLTFELNNGTPTVKPESIEDTKNANPDSKIFHALLDAIPLDKLNEALGKGNINDLLKANLTLKPNDDPYLSQFILEFANIKKLLNNPVRIGAASQNAITTEFL